MIPVGPRTHPSATSSITDTLLGIALNLWDFFSPFLFTMVSPQKVQYTTCGIPRKSPGVVVLVTQCWVPNHYPCNSFIQHTFLFLISQFCGPGVMGPLF